MESAAGMAELTLGMGGGNTNDFASGGSLSARTSSAALATVAAGLASASTRRSSRILPESGSESQTPLSSSHDARHAVGKFPLSESKTSQASSGITSTPTHPRLAPSLSQVIRGRIHAPPPFFAARKLQPPERMLGLTQQDISSIFSQKVAILIDEQDDENGTFDADVLSDSDKAEATPPANPYPSPSRESEKARLSPESVAKPQTPPTHRPAKKASTSQAFFRNNEKANRRYHVVSKVKHGRYGDIVVALRVATNELVIIKQVNIFSLPVHLRYTFPCTGRAYCKCPNCSQHPVQPLTVGPSAGHEVIAAAAAAAAASHTLAHSGSSHTHHGAIAPADDDGSSGERAHPFLAPDTRQELPIVSRLLFSPDGPFSYASPVSSDSGPARASSPPASDHALPSPPPFDGIVPLELVALQTENDADELPSFIEYWVHKASGTFYFVTRTHGPRQRRWRDPKTWFRPRFFEVNWEEYLM